MNIQHAERRRLALALALGPFTLVACGGGSSSSGTPASPAGSISITSQPAPLEVTAGQTATFSVTATGTGTGALSYQWMKNGIAIAGATSSTYSVVAQISDSGAVFSVQIMASSVTVTSQGALLTVNNGTLSYFWKNPGAGLSPTLPLGVDGSGNVLTVLQSGSPLHTQAGQTVYKITPQGTSTAIYTFQPYRSEVYQQSNVLGAMAVSAAGTLIFIRIDAAAFDIFVTGNLNLQQWIGGSAGSVHPLLDGSGGIIYTDSFGYNKTIAMTMDSSGDNIYVAGFKYSASSLNPFSPVIFMVDAIGNLRQEITVPSGWIIKAMALDPSGSLLALASVGTSRTATGGQIVGRLGSSGAWTVVAGSPTQSGYLDGAGAKALFGSVDSIAIDKNSHLYIADGANNLIRRVDASTAIVSTLAGTPGLSINQLGALPGALQSPDGLTFDANGVLYMLSGSDILKLTLPS